MKAFGDGLGVIFTFRKSPPPGVSKGTEIISIADDLAARLFAPQLTQSSVGGGQADSSMGAVHLAPTATVWSHGQRCQARSRLIDCSIKVYNLYSRRRAGTVYPH